MLIAQGPIAVSGSFLAAIGASPRDAASSHHCVAMFNRGLEAGRRTGAEALLGDMLRRAKGFGIAARLLRAAWCHLQVHENRLAGRH
jgi:ketopantoate reductase